MSIESDQPPDSATTCLPSELLDQRSSEGSAHPTGNAKPTGSVFSRSDSAPVHNVPMCVIHRPLPSELDEKKVKAFMEEMKAGDAFTPIEVVKVRAPLRNDPTQTPQNFYFAMGGCHRYEATKRLGLETIRARIIDVPAAQMRIYLGAGSAYLILRGIAAVIGGLYCSGRIETLAPRLERETVRKGGRRSLILAMPTGAFDALPA